MCFPPAIPPIELTASAIEGALSWRFIIFKGIPAVLKAIWDWTAA